MAEKVSVLLAVPVGGDSVRAENTRNSIDAQTYPQALVEVVSVDYVATVPGARVSALNAARETASGTFVIQADLGEVWDGHKVERQVDVLQTSAEAFGCVHQMTGGQGGLSLKVVRDYGMRVGSLLGVPWRSGAAMLTREAMAELGAYRSIEEATWEYVVRMATRGCELHLMEEELSVWQGDVDTTRRLLIPKGIRHRFLTAYLTRMDVEALFRELSLDSLSDGHLVRGALFQKNDDLETAHEICQQIDRETGCAESSYWHGIIHRREPDFNNARGWFRKAENLGCNGALYRAVSSLLQQVIQQPDYGSAREIALVFLRHLQAQSTWDALYLVDLCERVTKGQDGDLRRFLEEIQEVEFDTLFAWTFRKAVGEVL